MSKRASISVCMAVYNGEKFIRQQIESVLSELQINDELVICDDLSTDETAKIVGEFSTDGRVKFSRNSHKLGVVKNFECALKKAQGEYIFLCDQDDIWLAGKVEACVSGLNNHLLVITDCIVVNEELETLSPSFFKLRNSGEGVLKNIWKNTYLGCCMAFRRDLLSISLPIPQSIPMHDMWLGLLAQANGSVLFINSKLSLYRRHKFAVSPTGTLSNFGVLKQVKLRLILVWYFLYRMLQVKIYAFRKKWF